MTLIRSDGQRVDLALPGASAAAVSSDGSKVAGGGVEGVGRIWSVDAQVLRELDGHRGPITDVAFSSDGQRVATPSSDRTAADLGRRHGGRFVRWWGSREVSSVSVQPGRQFVLTASLDHKGRLWNSDTGARTQVLRWHFGRVIDATFSPDGRWIVTAGPVTVGLWRSAYRSRPPLRVRRAQGGLLTSAAFDPTGHDVLASSFDGTVRRAECRLCVDLTLCSLSRGHSWRRMAAR